MTLTVTNTTPVSDAVSTEALVALAREGSEQAVRHLVQRHNRQLFRVARGVVRDDGEAEDIVQETYVRAFTNLTRFRGDAAFATWLTRIALNEALGRLRRRRTMVDLSETELNNTATGGHVVMFPMSSPSASPESEADREQVRRVLEKAVDGLPDPFRIVLILRDIEGLSAEETATLLSIRAETVKTRLHRGRRLMRQALERQLGKCFAGLFPFDGQRCVRMADRVVDRLGAQA